MSPIAATACVIHVGVVDLGIAKSFYYLLSKTLSVISCVIGLFSAKTWLKMFVHSAKFIASSTCSAIAESTEDKTVKNWTTACSAAIFIVDCLNFTMNKTYPRALKAIVGTMAADTVKDVISEVTN